MAFPRSLDRGSESVDCFRDGKHRIGTPLTWLTIALIPFSQEQHQPTPAKGIDTMATTIGTAISTSTEVPSLEPSRTTDNNPSNHAPELNGKPGQSMEKKYRHIAAVHSRPRTSCLSHDSDASPSFLGFRNLMVIVLSKYVELPLCSCAW